MAEEAQQVNQKNLPSGKTEKNGVLNIENFSEYMAVWIVILVPLFVFFEVTSNLPRPWGSYVSSVLYFLLILFLTFSTVGIYKEEAIAARQGKVLSEEQVETEAPKSTSWILVSAIVTLVAFGEICGHLFQALGGFDGIDASQTSFWLWLRFGVDQILDHVLFGIRSIFNWHISDISPTAPLSRTLVLLFNIDLDALVIAAVLSQFQLIRRSWRRWGSIQYTNFPVLIGASLQRLVVLSLWVLPLLIGIEATKHNSLSLETAWTAVKFGMPVIFGGMLIWYSLHVLRLHGWWNKLFALAGIPLGCWLFYWGGVAFLADLFR